MKKLIYILMIASLSLAGCSGKTGFQSIDAALKGSPEDNNGQGDGGDNGGGTDASWDDVDGDGYSQGGDTKGKLVIQIDKENEAMILILPVPSFLFLPFTSSQVSVPDLEGAYFSSYETADGDKKLAVSVPLRHIIKGAEFQDGQRLPNGDALPYVPAGELPGFAIQFPNQPKYRVHLYIGVNIAAAFVELPELGIPFSGLHKVKNKEKTKEIGAIGYIAPKGSFEGGLYLAAQLPKDMAIVIDELIRW